MIFFCIGIVAWECSTLRGADSGEAPALSDSISWCAEMLLGCTCQRHIWKKSKKRKEIGILKIKKSQRNQFKMPLSTFFLCVIYQIEHTCVSHVLCFLGRISPITLMPVTFASCLDPVASHICRKARTHKIKLKQVQSESQQQKQRENWKKNCPKKRRTRRLS